MKGIGELYTLLGDMPAIEDMPDYVVRGLAAIGLARVMELVDNKSSTEYREGYDGPKSSVVGDMIYHILEATGRAIHRKEIARKLLEMGAPVNGNTPEKVMQEISTILSRDGRFGRAPRRGYWQLARGSEDNDEPMLDFIYELLRGTSEGAPLKVLLAAALENGYNVEEEELQQLLMADERFASDQDRSWFWPADHKSKT